MIADLRDVKLTRLVFARRPGQTIVVDGPAVITVHKLTPSKTQILVEAPASTKVLRGELLNAGRGRRALPHQ